MSRYLLDTDAVIDYLLGVAGSVTLIQGLYDRGDVLCACDVVIAEVHAGLAPHERDKAHSFLSGLDFLPTSLEAAAQAGDWRYLYARRGMTLATTDVLIAATAHAHQASIITANRRDYPMPEVSLLPLPRAGG